jgi:hypothetical protein
MQCTATKRYRTSRGATLPEIITVAALAVVLLTGMVTMAVNASTEWSRGSSQVSADDSASMALQNLVRDAREGISLRTAVDGTELFVRMPAGAGTEYNRYTPGAEVRYYRDSLNRLMRQGGGTTRMLGEGVARIRFIELTNGSVAVQLTSTQRNGTSERSSRLDTQITLRNLIP